MKPTPLLAAALALCAPLAWAQPTDLPRGIWKRLPTDTAKASYYLFEPVEGGVRGVLLTPPEGMTCEVELRLEESRLVGAATWKEEGYPDLQTRWEYTLEEAGRLVGRSEWVAWDEEGKESRGWEDHTFVPAPAVGLVTSGDAPEAPFGEPVDDLESLAGGWAGPGGAWKLSVDGPLVTLVPVGDHHPEARIALKYERGTFQGQATLGGNQRCRLELAFDEGALRGRSTYVQAPELGDKARHGWAPLVFTRLERLEAAPPAPEAPAPGEGSPIGVWKRDDGLYLRVREEGGEVAGVLCDASGRARCRLRFVQENGLWIGTANWGDLETRWELSASEDALVGRCEWVDVHEGQVVARGWGARRFVRLRGLH
ncbi:MAG: hypothetical protein D6731_19260 [Planctomycetota bacterium]|nr:MAG: hypothetical protein D6731_19260 [Planctomycetota bacterium]